MSKTVTNSSSTPQKIASIIALIIGLMSIFAGSKVLLGIDFKNYNVLVWLVSYNVIFGFISVAVSYLIWSNNKKATMLTLFILSMHFVVFLYLKFISTIAASESIKAMTFRTGIWIIIAILTILVPKYLRKK